MTDDLVLNEIYENDFNLSSTEDYSNNEENVRNNQQVVTQ